MDTPSYSEKKQSILILLLLLAIWAAGLWALAHLLEPAGFTLALCFFSAALYGVLREIIRIKKKAQYALSQAEMFSELNRMKNQSYTDLSHEMKTPLTVISVNAQLAVKNLEVGILDEETLTDIKIISAEASRLTQMVSSLVGLGQLQGSDTGCSLLSADTLIRTTARTYQALSERYGNTLTVLAEPDLPPVYGNADRLAQVLINLITNANRHTRNGCVTISIKVLADQIEVSVTDNGEGIEPGLLPHVFERFCRGDKGDTGLGLPICKMIIREHGGEMGIESEAGNGTRVWFTLPAAGIHCVEGCEESQPL